MTGAGVIANRATFSNGVEAFFPFWGQWHLVLTLMKRGGDFWNLYSAWKMSCACRCWNRSSTAIFVAQFLIRLRFRWEQLNFWTAAPNQCFATRRLRQLHIETVIFMAIICLI